MINLKLTYSNDRNGLRGFADAYLGSDLVDRQSYSGYASCLSFGAISWRSRKQRSVALSSAEAEYMSISDAAKEAICLSKLLKEIGFWDLARTVLFNDNQSAGKLAKNPVFHARSKHIDIRTHFVRNTIKDAKLELRYLPTEKMPADILTKALPKAKVDICVKELGLL